jgi:hypothetical protein
MRLGEFFRVGRKAHVEAERAEGYRRHFPQHIMRSGVVCLSSRWAGRKRPERGKDSGKKHTD